MQDARKERWQELTETFSRTTDAIGCSIDEGILETVVALNAVGINTQASCEGHLDHGTAAPWVHIGAADALPLARQIHMKQKQAQEAESRGASLEERSKLHEETQEASRASKRLNMVERMKLMSYMDRFYAEHSVSCDGRLVLHTYGWTGVTRLTSQGADCQDCREAEERAAKLQEYQQEMQAFTTFLKQVYFSE